jgi:hypothetical protein
MDNEDINAVVKLLGYDVYHLVLRLRMRGAMEPLLHTAPCLAEGQFYIAHG